MSDDKIKSSNHVPEYQVSDTPTSKIESPKVEHFTNEHNGEFGATFVEETKKPDYNQKPGMVKNPNTEDDYQQWEERFNRTGSMFADSDPLLDAVRRTSSIASYSAANAANLYGINHRMTPLATMRNTDHQGFTFFTRPDLRLSYDNLIQDRNFSLMLNKVDPSIVRWVRATLDPRGARWRNYGSLLVDNLNPFIPILTNSLKSISGWTEMTVDPWTSDAGHYNESWSQADGRAYDYETRDIQCTFDNQVGDPINRLFYVWTRYQMLVHEGVIDPYLNNCVMNIFDYNTRIYRLVTDPTKQFVQHIAACGAAFPLNSGMSSKFDFTRDSPFSSENDQVSIQFKIMGTSYDDPILIREFNKTVYGFNPGMVPEFRANNYVQLAPDEWAMFNTMGYPHIEEENGRIHWYVNKRDYEAILSNQKRTGMHPSLDEFGR